MEGRQRSDLSLRYICILFTSLMCHFNTPMTIGARALPNIPPREENPPFLMDYVQCNGRESALTDCEHLEARDIRSTCSINDNAGAYCVPRKFNKGCTWDVI